jgi:transposase-like protein
MSIMETMAKKRPRPRRSFAPEFKAEIVELCRRGDRSVGQVAKDFDLTETAVREWVKQADLDAGGTRRQRADAELAERIRHHHRASKGRNGAPRIHVDLADEGRHHGRKRVARLMREHGIIGRHRRRNRRTTDPDPAAAARADLIGRDFTVDPNKINTRWCGDITRARRCSGLR